MQRLREADALRETDDIVHGVLDRIEPVFAEDWPAALDARVRDSLIAAGMTTPYKHQAEAIELALTGCSHGITHCQWQDIGVCRPNAPRPEERSPSPGNDDLSHEGAGLRPAGAVKDNL